MSPGKKSIEEQLREELEIEHKRFEDIRAEFGLAMSTIPTGMQSPDGVAYIKLISAQERLARERLQAALQRFNDFVIRGVVPDDLK